MRMPGIAREPLPDHLQEIRNLVMSLPVAERRQLRRHLNADLSRSNDATHEANYQRAERERSRRRPDPRQMSLEDAA